MGNGNNYQVNCRSFEFLFTSMIYSFNLFHGILTYLGLEELSSNKVADVYYKAGIKR